jgi:ribonuclease HII
LKGPTEKIFVEVTDVDSKIFTEEQTVTLKEVVRRLALNFLVLEKQKINDTKIADYAHKVFEAHVDAALKRTRVILKDDMCQLSDTYPIATADLIVDIESFTVINLFLTVDYTHKENVVSVSNIL